MLCVAWRRFTLLWIGFPCYALLAFALVCIASYALLRDGLCYIAFHCFALLSFSLLCVAWHCFNLLYSACVCVRKVWIALLCDTMHCFTLPYFATREALKIEDPWQKKPQYATLAPSLSPNPCQWYQCTQSKHNTNERHIYIYTIIKNPPFSYPWRMA